MLVISVFLPAVRGACMVDCSRFWFWYIISHACYFCLSSSCPWGLYGGLQPLLVLVYNISCSVFPHFFQLSVEPVWWTAAASGSRIKYLMLGISSLSSSCLWGLYGGLQPLLVLVYNISCSVFFSFFQLSVEPVWWTAAASGPGI